MEMRYTAPSRFEEAKYNAICKVMRDDNNVEWYVQTSIDPKCPDWQKLGSLFESSFNNELKDQEIVTRLVILYNEKKDSFMKVTSL